MRYLCNPSVCQRNCHCSIQVTVLQLSAFMLPHLLPHAYNDISKPQLTSLISITNYRINKEVRVN